MNALDSKREKRGIVLANRILAKYPKLEELVLARVERPFNRVDGIEFWCAPFTTQPPSIAFLVPQEAWELLTDDERIDLAFYMEDRIRFVRDNPEAYFIISKRAPEYRAKVANARNLREGAWVIRNTMTYPDDPEQNLYGDKILQQGPSYVAP